MTTVITRKNVPFGLSLPKELMKSIDEKRGDISRSKFVSRLLERNFSKQVTKKNVFHNKKRISVDRQFLDEDQQVIGEE